jgi:hypothetical protein
VVSEEPRWLLLIHQIPPEPAYLRVKIGRRLQALGAVPLKNSVYALPRSEESREDLAWVLREVATGGGEAFILAVTLLDGLRDDDLERRFQVARTADYERLVEHARKLEASLRPSRDGSTARPPRAAAELRRIERQLAATISLDFFEAPGRDIAEGLVAALGERLRAGGSEPAAPERRGIDLRSVRGGTWVTRRGVHVDRIASAWLIRRFLDPEARFRFVAPRGYQAKPSEIRFDMYDAEFTHEGDLCTFEVLLDAASIKDPALRAIAEVVHDIDLKDDKFGRAEAAGVAELLIGIAATERDDTRRLERGGVIFEDLYAALRRRHR